MNTRALKRLKLNILTRPIRLMKAWYLRHSSQSISCNEFNDIVYDHVNGDLSGKQSSSFQRHVNDCPICPNFLKAYISTYEAKSHVFPYKDIDVPDAVPQSLIDAILAINQKA